MLGNLRTGIIGGLFFATSYSVIVLLIYLLSGSEAFDAYGITLAETILIYFAGGIVGGIVVGLLFPLTKWRIGAMLVGIIAAIPVFLGFAVVIKGPPWAWDAAVIIGFMLGAVMLGAWGGYIMWEPPDANA